MKMKKSVIMRVVFAAMVVTLLLSLPTKETSFVDGNPQPPPPLLMADGNPQPPLPPPLKKWLVADGNPQPPRPPLSAMTV